MWNNMCSSLSPYHCVYYMCVYVFTDTYMPPNDQFRLMSNRQVSSVFNHIGQGITKAVGFHGLALLVGFVYRTEQIRPIHWRSDLIVFHACTTCRFMRCLFGRVCRETAAAMLLSRIFSFGWPELVCCGTSTAGRTFLFCQSRRTGPLCLRICSLLR